MKKRVGRISALGFSFLLTLICFDSFPKIDTSKRLNKWISFESTTKKAQASFLDFEYCGVEPVSTSAPLSCRYIPECKDIDNSTDFENHVIFLRDLHEADESRSDVICYYIEIQSDSTGSGISRNVFERERSLSENQRIIGSCAPAKIPLDEDRCLLTIYLDGYPTEPVRNNIHDPFLIESKYNRVGVAVTPLPFNRSGGYQVVLLVFK